MAAPAIKVEGVGKRYRMGRGYGTDSNLSTRIDAAFRAPFRLLTGGRGRSSPAAAAHPESFWAVRDMSFEVQPGERLGLVGENGAGKSTMLKLLARITAPTEGRIEHRGLLGSLLEVGTGFHPDLTGRDNIFLNGAILGMRRKEIMARYDEIVEFSEIGNFIETPVKRYSSGMFVRLAFSVAIHLEPDILLIDEVLAVGDAAFQRKSLNKMEQVSTQSGRAIVFVSHNANAIRKVCDRAILIEDGRMVADGPSDTVLTDYLERIQPIQHGGVSVIAPDVLRSGSGEARITRVSLHDDDHELIETVRYRQPFTLAIEVESETEILDAVFLIRISDGEGLPLAVVDSLDGGGHSSLLSAGRNEVRVRFDDLALLPGEFVIDASINHAGGATIDWVDRAISLNSINAPAPGGDERYPWETYSAPIRTPAAWSVGSEEPVATQRGSA